MDDKEEKENQEQARRARRSSSGLSFAERRQIVADRIGVEVVDAKIENHMSSCEGFRKVVLSAIALVVSIIMVPIGFMLTEIYQIKGRQDVVISRLSTIDNTFASERESLSTRLSSIVTANAERERTFNSRFADILESIQSLQRDFHAHELRMNRALSDESSTGPTRRRRE